MGLVRRFPGLLQWIGIGFLIAAVLIVGVMTNVTLRSVEKNLPNTLLSELHDLSLSLEHIATVIHAVEKVKFHEGEEHFKYLKEHIQVAYEDVVNLRNTYVYDNLVNASAFHAVTAPAIADLKTWFSEGVSGFGPDSQVTVQIALVRITGAYDKARLLYHESQEKAQAHLDRQRKRIEKFLLEANLLFVLALVITVGMVFMFFRQLLFQQREAKAQVEKRRAQQSLMESEKKHRILVETTDTGYFIIDEQGVLLDANKEFVRITGHSDRDEILGKSIFEWTREQESDMYREAIASCLKKGFVRDLEIDTLSAGGERIPIEINAAVLETEKGRQILSLCRDISERKRTQELMLQSDKMMSIGGLAAGMAHEINNPIAGMLQNSQVALNRLTLDIKPNLDAAKAAGFSMDSLREYIEKRDIVMLLTSVREAGERAARLVSNMLSFSRRQGNIREFHSVVDLLEATIELAGNDFDLKKRFDFKKIEIIRDYDNETPSIQCNATMIQQVFFNLLKNGAEAMAHERVIESKYNPEHHGKPSRFWVRVKSREDWVFVEIEDNGTGMEESIRKRVFEPFYTTKTVGTGTGLGMSLSYFIITRNHGGTMEVESQPGKGTRYIMRLPVHQV